MTRISSTTIIITAFATVALSMFSQGASASTGGAQSLSTEKLKYCARMENQDTTGCRDFERMKKQVRLIKQLNEGGRGGG